MARMIDADRLLRELTALSHGQVWPGWTYDGIRLLIERQPTLTQPNEPLTLEELREVPHGKIKDSTLQSICDRVKEIARRPPEGEEEEKHVIEITENL